MWNYKHMLVQFFVNGEFLLVVTVCLLKMLTVFYRQLLGSVITLHLDHR